MASYCSECGQRLPQAPGMICAQCHGKIRKGHRWHVVGSLVMHRDCQNPRLDGVAPEEQESFLEARDVDG